MKAESTHEATLREEIKQAAARIQQGDVVAFETETVYGLGASAWDADAIRKVFALKGRPADNPLIVHVSHPDEISQFAADIPERAVLLINHFWPGPLTVILPKKPAVLDILTGGLDTVALRMPAHPLALAFLEESGPLVAPSANRSGRPSPTTREHVLEDLGPEVMVLGRGACSYGLESTVLDLSASSPILCRPGHLSMEDFSTVLGEPILSMTHAKDGQAPRSPGMKYTHYSPDATVSWASSDVTPPPRSLWLVHSDIPTKIAEGVEVIDYAGDFRKMARELYDRFRQADHEARPVVLIEPLPSGPRDGVLAALANRINKAVGA
ncbi:MAG: threonylcarbamoyl-AMP synthase [Myxococcales bacterium]|nr:threonylcarbamoyl-AMP synthase [Myxococcales bacterium]MCB9644925.1 threonylcarbamoyl-AMP synthase [Myxococcales bacterium]